MRALALSIAVGAALLPAAGRANCAMPVGYDVQAGADGRVTVCLRNFAQRSCPDHGLLRERVDTGELVQLTSCDAAGCFVDECVPAGTYRYGLAIPYTCEPSACSTSYWGVADAPGAGAGCVRSGAAPVVAASTPWSGASDLVCPPYHGPGPGLGSGKWNVGCGSCSSSGPVFAGNALLLVAGAGLWARRRRGRG